MERVNSTVCVWQLTCAGNKPAEAHSTRKIGRVSVPAPQAGSSPRGGALHILMRIITTFVALTAFVAGMSMVAAADEQGSKTAIEKKLESEYALTKTTADRTDIVTAGSVVVLQKDKLLMVAASSSANPCPNTYKDGKLTPNAGCKTGEVLRRIPGFGSHIPGADKAPATRIFVSGEKFWVTKIDVKSTDKGFAVVMDFFTDAINDVRYRASLTIPFKEGAPTPDEALKLVREVVTVAPSDDAKGDEKQEPSPAQGGQQSPATAAEGAPPPLAPPPPPADDVAATPTVSLGQTPEQVIAILGQPLRKAKAGPRDLYFYKDMKVTFLNGKVKDIQ
jgi:hypothetical protein